MKTTRDCFVTTIHSLTRREIDEGTLAAGARARKIHSDRTPHGEETTFEASTDRGKHWYIVRTFEPRKGLFTQNRR